MAAALIWVSTPTDGEPAEYALEGNSFEEVKKCALSFPGAKLVQVWQNDLYLEELAVEWVSKVMIPAPTGEDSDVDC